MFYFWSLTLIIFNMVLSSWLHGIFNKFTNSELNPMTSEQLMNNFCPQLVLHIKTRMQQSKWSIDSRWVDIPLWIRHWLLRVKGDSHVTQSVKMLPLGSNQFWQVFVSLSSYFYRSRGNFKEQLIFWIMKVSGGCVCVWMCDLYLKYEPMHVGIGKMEGIFGACFFFLPKKLVYHSVLLPAVCSRMIYEKGL